MFGNDDRPATDGAAAYMAREPKYRPYVSVRVPHQEEGYRAVEHAMRMARWPEFLASLLGAAVQPSTLPCPGSVLDNVLAAPPAAVGRLTRQLGFAPRLLRLSGIGAADHLRKIGTITSRGSACPAGTIVRPASAMPPALRGSEESTCP